MQYVWGHRLWPSERMSTTDGRRITVLDPGRLNTDAGPDFFNAKVKIDGNTWAGNIEIHVKASDWHRHGHDGDPAYDNVILHVVDTSDTLIRRPDGSAIPQLQMCCAPDLNRHYSNLISLAPSDIACRSTIAATERVFLRDWLDSLAMERLYEKTDRVEQWAQRFNGDWEQAAFITIARALGSGINGEIFERLAASVPLRMVARHNDSVMMTEAILFGQSGLLDQAPQNDYTEILRREYRFLCAKFSLSRPQGMMWKMARMRPASFPHRRIALLASVLHRSTRFMWRISEVMRDDSPIECFERLFALPPEGFWADHYTFSENTASNPSTRTCAVGKQTLNTLLINAVIPISYAYALHSGDTAMADRSLELLHTVPAESNTIVRGFTDAGIPCEDAADSQALIQLRRSYCEQRKCLYCRIGHKVLSHAAVRP